MSTLPPVAANAAWTEPAALKALDRLALLALHFACLSSANARTLDHEFTSVHACAVWELLEECHAALTADREHFLAQQRTWALPRGGDEDGRVAS